MPSVKVVQLSHQLRKDGTIPVVIRVINDRKTTYIKTGYAVKSAQFREGSEKWVTKHPDADLLNAAIEKKRQEISSKVIIADLDNATIDTRSLTGAKFKTGKGTFFNAIKNVMANYESRKQVAALTRLNTNLQMLKECWGRDIAVADIDKKWVQKFVNYRFKKNNSISTVKKNLTDLAAVYTHEQIEGKNPFSEFAKTLHPEPVQRDKLSAQDIQKLEDIQLEGLYDLARDMFLFCFYSHGMRFESMASLSKDSIKQDVILYRMNKGKKVREIEIHPKLRAILDKYNGTGPLYYFPVLNKRFDEWTKKDVVGSANTLLNDYLKGAARIAGIDQKISFHIARHSFAMIGIQRGVGFGVMKDALGHSKYSTTEKYLKSLSDDHVNKEVRRVFE